MTTFFCGEKNALWLRRPRVTGAAEGDLGWIVARLQARRPTKTVLEATFPAPG